MVMTKGEGSGRERSSVVFFYQKSERQMKKIISQPQLKTVPAGKVMTSWKEFLSTRFKFLRYLCEKSI